MDVCIQSVTTSNDTTAYYAVNWEFIAESKIEPASDTVDEHNIPFEIKTTNGA